MPCLYTLTERSLAPDEDIVQQVTWLLRAGATVVQYRDKHVDDDVFRAIAQQLRALCDRHGALFIINDKIAIAAELGVALHVGQSDFSDEKALRSLVRQWRDYGQPIGVSTSTVQQAMQAESAGTSYIGIGPVFPSTTKTDEHAIGLVTAAAIVQAVGIPTVAIGGINAANYDQVRDTGVSSMAMISAINKPTEAETARAYASFLRTDHEPRT